MSGLETKVKRQFDWPPSKNEKVVYSDTEGVWVVQSTEVQAFGNVLIETSEEDLDEDQTAMLGEQETFGDVLDQQYQHDTSVRSTEAKRRLHVNFLIERADRKYNFYLQTLPP